MSNQEDQPDRPLRRGESCERPEVPAPQHYAETEEQLILGRAFPAAGQTPPVLKGRLVNKEEYEVISAATLEIWRVMRKARNEGAHRCYEWKRETIMRHLLCAAGHAVSAMRQLTAEQKSGDRENHLAAAITRLAMAAALCEDAKNLPWDR